LNINRTLCDGIAKFVRDEENCDVDVAFATFQYNCSPNSTTGVSPYFAMFARNAFEFDAVLLLELGIDDQPDDRPSTMAKIYQVSMSTAFNSGDAAATNYARAVKECNYEVGDQPLVYRPPGAMEQSRKR
jgi:hypothetical protein